MLDETNTTPEGTETDAPATPATDAPADDSATPVEPTTTEGETPATE